LIALLLVILSLLITAGVVLVVFLALAVVNAAPAVMTPPGVIPAVLEALELTETGLLVDLGCGDGRVLRAAVAKEPQLRAQGVENNPVTALLAWWRLRGRGQVKWGDMLGTDLDQADRVFLYLSPVLMEALEPKLEREMKSGAKVVSMHYRLPNRTAEDEVDVAGAPAHARRLFIYQY
jgi:hypothetical protein